MVFVVLVDFEVLVDFRVEVEVVLPPVFDFSHQEKTMDLVSFRRPSRVALHSRTWIYVDTGTTVYAFSAASVEDTLFDHNLERPS